MVQQVVKRNNFSKCNKKYQLNAQFIIVNEAGASVYSASEIARNEFPEFQVEEEVQCLLVDVCKIRLVN